METAAPQLPDTPVGRQCAAWLDVFNDSARNDYGAFLKRSYPLRAAALDEEWSFRQMTGGFTLRKVEESQATRLVALVQERDSDVFARLTMEVDRATPHVITWLDLQTIDRPAEFALPHLSEGALLVALRTKLDDYARSDRFSGAILFARHARVLHAEAYGFADRDRRIANTLQTRFRIGSMNKMFTATAILQLVAAGKLSLDAHLSTFVPDIANGDVITVQQLLNMTSGVYSYTEDDTFLTDYFAIPQMPFTPDDALAIVRAHEPDFAPGTDIHYSDSNFVLLELIAEELTGEPFGDTITSQILDKVGLDATSYPITDAMPEPFTHGYLAQPFGGPRDVTLGNPGVGGGAGAMISTLEDLHKWAVALGTGTLLPRELQRQRLVSKAMVTTPTVKFSYGMGITEVNGFYGHDGGILGYASAMFYLPKERATIVVLANSDNVSAQSALWTFIGIASYLYPKQFPKGL